MFNFSMTKMEGAPQSPGEVVAPLTVDQNVTRVGELIETDIQSWEAAIEAGEGSVIHHEGEIMRLRELSLPITDIVQRYGITEPVDPAFIIDVAGYLSAAQHDFEVTGIKPSREIQEENVASYLEDLRARNSGIAAEAA